MADFTMNLRLEDFIVRQCVFPPSSMAQIHRCRKRGGIVLLNKIGTQVMNTCMVRFFFFFLTKQEKMNWEYGVQKVSWVTCKPRGFSLPLRLALPTMPQGVYVRGPLSSLPKLLSTSPYGYSVSHPRKRNFLSWKKPLTKSASNTDFTRTVT